jgi:RNA polymerase sigma-70 factor (ECF subfamily)
MPDHRLDIQLIEAAKQGDPKAFEHLMGRYQTRVSKIVRRFIKDPHETLDICQEVFIKIYRALDQFRGDSSFYTWLYRVSINTAKNYLALKEHALPSVDLNTADLDHFLIRQMPKEQATPEQLMIRDQVEKMVYDTIRALPDDLREAITLRELEGKSYDAIANIMQCPIGTVRSRIFRARSAIDKNVQSLG